MIILRNGPKKWISLKALAIAGALLASPFSIAIADEAAPAIRPNTANKMGQPNLKSNIGRTMRYTPENGAFVIENGREKFNRALYGGNTAFRVEAGDLPEFLLYLPGRGGNLRLAAKGKDFSFFIHEAQNIKAKYRAGKMIYEISDPRLGTGNLEINVLALGETEGLILKIRKAPSQKEFDLIVAYGGIDGERGSRDGDIGTERVPISEYFLPRAKSSIGNTILLSDDTATVQSKIATIAITATSPANWRRADAANWNSLPRLLEQDDSATEAPIALGTISIKSKPEIIALQRLAINQNVNTNELEIYRAVRSESSEQKKRQRLQDRFTPIELTEKFDSEDRRIAKIRRQLIVETPDPYLNASIEALNVGADATWDEEESAVMHGAIAWRSKLLGWRGAYMLDALGWHERAKRNIKYWMGRQNTNPIPNFVAPAEEKTNLARNPEGLHTNGDMSNSHYDMNSVFIDILFRHLLWTGDKELATEAWPVIERHLAWQQRLFRRTFGADKDPLYEGYASIWASDNLQYHGGAAAYQSAYVAYHNRMAAKLANWLGHDPSAYNKEADAIEAAMRKHFWIEESNRFAEFKDILGEQLVHPDAAIWTYYHIIDSEIVDQQTGWKMIQSMKKSLPSIPIRIDENDFGLMYSVSGWKPYMWSINNIVMAENMHAALAMYQVGDSLAATKLLRASAIVSMFTGISPGNVGSLNSYDVYRRESMRDFADGSGVMSRAVVEGLFGIRPDAIAGQLTISPHFPSTWNHASIDHKTLSFDFRRRGSIERYVIKQSSKKFNTLRLKLGARASVLKGIRVNGAPIEPNYVLGIGQPYIEVIIPFNANSTTIDVAWSGSELATIMDTPTIIGAEQNLGPMKFLSLTEAKSEDKDIPDFIKWQQYDWSKPNPNAKFDFVNLTQILNLSPNNLFKPGAYVSPRSPYVSLAMPSQGIGGWAGGVNLKANIDESGLRKAVGESGGVFKLANGIPFSIHPTAENSAAFVSQWDRFERSLSVPLSGNAKRAFVLMVGSTNHMQSNVINGEVIVKYEDGTSEVLPLINPSTWWPIDQDYFIDDYQFRHDFPIPPRIDLKTGKVRYETQDNFKGKGRTIDGGAASILVIELNPQKTLKDMSIRAVSNEVVIGIMAATLER